MNRDTPTTARGHHRSLRKLWPWLVLCTLWIPAIWHVVDFEDDLDAEFPQIVRPTFSRRPPSAYRLADPGDTLDRVLLYVAAASVVVATTGLVLGGRRSLWPAAWALAAAGVWYSATPGPAVDGWHGLGWRAIADPAAPASLRVALLVAALILAGIIASALIRRRASLRDDRARAGQSGSRALFVVAALLMVISQFELIDFEPHGYWPRWSRIAALVAATLALAIALSQSAPVPRRRRLAVSMAALGWLVLVAGGIWVTWYHRPLARFKEVVPGQIFMSAMPTKAGWRSRTPGTRSGRSSISFPRRQPSAVRCWPTSSISRASTESATSPARPIPAKRPPTPFSIRHWHSRANPPRGPSLSTAMAAWIERRPGSAFTASSCKVAR